MAPGAARPQGVPLDCLPHRDCLPHQVPRDLKMRLRRYYSHYYSKKTVFDEEAILGSLSPELRFEVVRHALKETIGRIPLFGSTLAPHFQLEVFPLLKPLAAVSGELILRRGDVPTDLLFLLKGVIEVVSGVHGKPLYRLHEGQHFGESVLTGRRRSANHVAESPCEMLAISAADLSDLFDRRPREGRSMYRALLNEHKRKELMRTIGLRFQMGHLEEVGRIEDAYAIALQLAWNRHCDRVAFALVEDIWQPEDTTLESTISGSIIAPRALVASLTDHHVSRHASPSLSKPPTSPNAGAAGAETFAGGFGAAGADAALSKRLLRVDGLLAKLEALALPLEQALGATSRGDLKPKLSDRLRH
jgi:CRP-like cAMP-binding protein